MQMVMFIGGNGRKIKLKGKECIVIGMVLDMKGNGRETSNMDRG